jgi:formamidopyrimidine-DNA glycosylase
LGPDPTAKNFDFNKFQERLFGKKGKIKTVLMDQSVFAGIGNIYSDEILWLSGIHPLRPVSSLTQEELKSIFNSTKKILKRALEARGTSDSDYRDPFGKKGGYQNMLYVYGLKGEKCQKKDGGIIARIKVGSRSAHFCPIHQKM